MSKFIFKKTTYFKLIVSVFVFTSLLTTVGLFAFNSNKGAQANLSIEDPLAPTPRMIAPVNNSNDTPTNNENNNSQTETEQTTDANTEDSITTADNDNKVLWVSRFYKSPEPDSPTDADHYYSTNVQSIWNSNENMLYLEPELSGYRSEGIRFGLYKNRGPVCPQNFRLLNVYSTNDNRIDHFLGFERPNSVSNYQQKGLLGCIATTPTGSATTPLYKYWDHIGRNNFYTTDKNEASIANRRPKDGQIIGYVISRPNTRAIYEFYSKKNRHFVYSYNYNFWNGREDYVFTGSPFVLYNYNNQTGVCSGSTNYKPLYMWYNPTLKDHYYITENSSFKDNELIGKGYSKLLTPDGRYHRGLGCLDPNRMHSTQPMTASNGNNNNQEVRIGTFPYSNRFSWLYVYYSPGRGHYFSTKRNSPPDSSYTMQREIAGFVR